jgi:hypothetical protein
MLLPKHTVQLKHYKRKKHLTIQHLHEREKNIIIVYIPRFKLLYDA